MSANYTLFQQFRVTDLRESAYLNSSHDASTFRPTPKLVWSRFINQIDDALLRVNQESVGLGCG